VNGILRLRAELRGARTVLTDVYRTPPYVLGPPSHRSEHHQAEVIIQQVSPGLFPGEVHTIEITVAAGARLVVRGQSATKIYPCGEGQTCCVRANYVVEPDGELVLLPGELIPFQDADVRQVLDVALAKGARFITSEIITPGRIAMGECHHYRRLDLRLTVRREDRLVLVDRALIEPTVRDPRRLGVHGAFTCTGSLYLIGFDDCAIEHPDPQRHDDLWWDAGSVADLTTVRFLGLRAADIIAKREDLVQRALASH
jgi:urease accessory protein